MSDDDVSDIGGPVPLLLPREGLPSVVAAPDALDSAIARLAAGSGPIAVDAERASGYRYGQRAYLVQLRRVGAGTVLIDPIACTDLTGLADALAEAEWVVHAASQDLPCLADVGLRPKELFDTELAGRLLAYPRVGLGPLVEAVLGFSLEKGHAAADWSTRPLPEPWLVYAALDVEVLIELRDSLEQQLEAAGKLEWAQEEFAALAAAVPPAPRADPWRRTSGIHRVRSRRGLAAVRALWEARDRIAQERDVAPGRLLPDAAITAAAVAMPRTTSELAAVPGFVGRGARPHLSTWVAALRRAAALSEAGLPTPSGPVDGPPPNNRWAERDPAAAARLTACRAAVAALADEHGLATENLLQPDVVRRLCWEPPAPVTVETVAAALRASGARRWQVGLTATPLAKALQRLELRTS